jgi:hypothetical protein
MTIQPTNPIDSVSPVAATKPEQTVPAAAPAAAETAKKAQPDNLYEGQGENYDLSV